MLKLNQPVVVIAVAVLCGASSCVGQSPQPPSSVEQPQPGLLTIMFESTQFKRPTGLSVMEQVNVDTGWNINDYSRLWIGRIKAPVSGTIEVFAEADDGLRLEIGGQRIIDGWGKDQPRSGTFAAQKDQLLPLRLEYYQDGGTGFIRLYWSWPGQPRQLIPASAFFHTPEDRQQIEKIMAAAGPIVPAPIPPAPADTPDKSRVYIPGQADEITRPSQPVPARPGPHLFIDDYLIASSQNLVRQVCQPRRDPSIPNPILTSREDGTFQPYMSVSRSPETGRFRIWYGISTPDKNESASDLAYMESDDGIHWIRPHRVLPKPAPLQFGSEVLDRGPYWPQPDQRYVYSFWFGGLRLWVSPDGWN
ncbi:MAG TPA: PA14 domain-containing protein, partial [Tepidisphaeraceae bacterium]|nr:PA14 domain-containing protein [Tepidisphaeraceae bacterium]